MFTTKRMNVTKLLIQRTGTFGDQYRRPYNSSLDGATASKILEAVEGKNIIKASTLANTSMGFIAPQATPEHRIDIINGWGTPRLRFLLEVQHVDHMGVINNEYISGYTEYSDLSMNDRVDPKMTFYMNNVGRTRVVTHNTPLGSQTYQNVIDSSHILVNDKFTNAFDSNKLYTLAPESIVSHIDTAGIIGDEDGGSFFDTSTALTKANPTKSDRRNNIAPIYVSGLLDSYLQSARSEEYLGQNAILEDVRNNVSSTAFSDDPFLMWMTAHNKRKGYGYSDGNTFTLEDLVSLDPNTVNVMRVANRMQSNTHVAGSTCSWGGSDGTTQFASILSQSLPAYLSQYCFNKLHFMSTNYTMTGQIETVITNTLGYNNGIDQSKEIQSMIYRINTELLTGVSFGNTMPFKIEVNCDLIGETWIEVSLNGEPPQMFVSASYADALMSPIVTTNQGVLNGISNDFCGLMTSIVEQLPSHNAMAMNGRI